MTTVFAKNAGTVQQPASTVKMMTAIVMRQWVPDVDLDDVVSVTAADIVGGSTANLMNGDNLTYRVLAYGALVPSGNDAAHCIARNVGALIIAGIGGGSSDPYTRFVEEMNTQAAVFGLSTAVFADAMGTDVGDMMSAEDVSSLMDEMATDSFLVTVAGTLNYTMVITGANARSYGVTNFFVPGTAFPEHVASKYGITVAAGYCIALLWDTPSDGRRITVVMGEATEAAMYSTLRRLMNYELARSA